MLGLLLVDPFACTAGAYTDVPATGTPQATIQTECELLHLAAAWSNSTADPTRTLQVTTTLVGHHFDNRDFVSVGSRRLAWTWAWLQTFCLYSPVSPMVPVTPHLPLRSCSFSPHPVSKRISSGNRDSEVGRCAACLPLSPLAVLWKSLSTPNVSPSPWTSASYASAP